MRSGIFIVGILMLAGCQKVNIDFGDHASETFYVENAGASMHVLVEGNIASKIFILFVHGGPGQGSFIYNTDYISENLEDKYAIVYWDQRNSGASQGNCNKDNLTLDQIIDDLKKVVLVIKNRYGQDIDLFLLSHSFGGLPASGFLTTGDNQNLFKGYINTDGSHDYPKNDTLTREMLLNTGITEVARNNHLIEWEKIISYCNAHTGNFTLDESLELENLASAVEGYFADVTRVSYSSKVTRKSISDHLPLTSMLVNTWSSNSSGLIREISKKEFSSVLYRINIPVLLLYGKYDFICPSSLGNDFYSRISSAEKRMVISPISGHNFMFQDKVLFTDEVSQFIEKYK